MTKTTKTITIDMEIYQEVKSKGANISQICEDALYRYCRRVKKVEVLDPIDKILRRLKPSENKSVQIAMHSTKPEQRVFIANKLSDSIMLRTGVRIEPEEILKRLGITPENQLEPVKE